MNTMNTMGKLQRAELECPCGVGNDRRRGGGGGKDCVRGGEGQSGRGRAMGTVAAGGSDNPQRVQKRALLGWRFWQRGQRTGLELQSIIAGHYILRRVDFPLPKIGESGAAVGAGFGTK